MPFQRLQSIVVSVTLVNYGFSLVIGAQVSHGLDFGFQPVKAVNNDHTAAAKKPSTGLTKPSLVSSLSTSLKQAGPPLKRPLSHLSGSVAKV